MKEAIQFGPLSRPHFEVMAEMVTPDVDPAIERSFMSLYEILDAFRRIKRSNVPATLVLNIYNEDRSGRGGPSVDEVKVAIDKLPSKQEILERPLHYYDFFSLAFWDREISSCVIPYHSLYPVPGFLEGVYDIDEESLNGHALLKLLLGGLSVDSRAIVLPRVRFIGGDIQHDALSIFWALVEEHEAELPLILQGLEDELDLALCGDEVYMQAGIPVIRLEDLMSD